jgi:hypothetical protein
MVGRRRKHHIRSVKYPVKKIHVRVDCDNCYKWETVSMYENEVEEREFNTRFFECEHCGMVFCSVCLPAEGKLECPFCSRTRVIKLRPFDIYWCNVCLREWYPDKMCASCRYEKPSRS